MYNINYCRCWICELGDGMKCVCELPKKLEFFAFVPSRSLLDEGVLIACWLNAICLNISCRLMALLTDIPFFCWLIDMEDFRIESGVWE